MNIKRYITVPYFPTPITAVPFCMQSTQVLLSYSVLTLCKAFVLHIRHATVSIFHARFPNVYLRNVRTHGPRYSQLFPQSPKIRLYQMGPYNMRLATGQADLYRALAKLLWYLASGKSHVGYLANVPANPFVVKAVNHPLPLLEEM
jgi:hypothetical protein